MFVRWLMAALHLLALGVGLGAVVGRGWLLRQPLDDIGLRRAFVADNAWGLAAALWLATGLVRLLAQLEKPTGYYVHNWVFWLKMALFGVVFLLELVPMIALIRWRIARGRRRAIDTSAALTYSRISFAEAALLVLMVFVATAMARGYGL